MPEIKKSVVTKCEAAGTWDTKREPVKTFYFEEIIKQFKSPASRIRILRWRLPKD
mgnify:CR=1 FL=1